MCLKSLNVSDSLLKKSLNLTGTSLKLPKKLLKPIDIPELGENGSDSDGDEMFSCQT